MLPPLISVATTTTPVLVTVSTLDVFSYVSYVATLSSTYPLVNGVIFTI